MTNLSMIFVVIFLFWILFFFISETGRNYVYSKAAREQMARLRVSESDLEYGLDMDPDADCDMDCTCTMSKVRNVEGHLYQITVVPCRGKMRIVDVQDLGATV